MWEEIVKEATNVLVGNVIKSDQNTIEIKKEDLQVSLSGHLSEIKSLSEYITIKDFHSPKRLNSIYVDLGIKLTPKWKRINKKHFSQKNLEQIASEESDSCLKDKFEKYSIEQHPFETDDELITPVDQKNNQRRKNTEDEIVLPEIGTIEELVNTDFHLIIYGDPGAGKTTTLKFACYSILLTEDKFIKYNFPIFIQLRKLHYNESIFGRLADIIGISIEKNNDRYSSQKLYDILKDNVCRYLNDLSALILLDGIDEIPENYRDQILDEIELLFLNLKKSKVVITARNGAIDRTLQNVCEYELLPLDAVGISKFASKWLEDPKQMKDFLFSLKKSPFHDTVVRPLTLAYLCSLYSVYQELPEKPIFLYSKVVRMLVSDWDIERGIKRGTSLKHFDNDKKLEILYDLAFNLSAFFGGIVFENSTIRNCFNNIRSKNGLERVSFEKVLNTLEEHTGIIVRSAIDTYEFCHKSIQEYLCAYYIIRLPTIPSELIHKKLLPDEFAIAICLSSNPNEYFLNVMTILLENPSLAFYWSILNRLIIERPAFYKDFRIAIIMIVILYKLLGNDDNWKFYVETSDSINLVDKLQKLAKDKLFFGCFKDLSKICSIKYDTSQFCQLELFADYFVKKCKYSSTVIRVPSILF